MGNSNFSFMELLGNIEGTVITGTTSTIAPPPCKHANGIFHTVTMTFLWVFWKEKHFLCCTDCGGLIETNKEHKFK